MTKGVPAMTEQQAVRLWEDTVGDSGEMPTDQELTVFANAVLEIYGPAPTCTRRHLIPAPKDDSGW